MRNLSYYLFNLIVLLPVLILSLKTDVKPHRHIKGYVAGFLLVSIPFLLWDAYAISQGYWGFNSDFVVGPYLYGVPIEEMLFYITVPFAMLYVWGVVKKYVADAAMAGFLPLLCFGCLSAGTALLLYNHWDAMYTRTIAFITLGTILVAVLSRLTYTKRFWVFQLLLIGLFLVCNTVLTSLPIITYGAEHLSGIYFLDMPIEDYLFAFSFVNLFLYVYTFFDRKFTQQTSML